jgi:hypothetical protein
MKAMDHYDKFEMKIDWGKFNEMQKDKFIEELKKIGEVEFDNESGEATLTQSFLEEFIPQSLSDESKKAALYEIRDWSERSGADAEEVKKILHGFNCSHECINFKKGSVELWGAEIFEQYMNIDINTAQDSAKDDIQKKINQLQQAILSSK